MFARVKAELAAIRSSKRPLSALLAAPGQPKQIGYAVAIGMAIGWTPLFGFHLLISVLAAIIFRLNAVIVYAAANISIPPLIPLIAASCIQVGHFVLAGSFLPLREETIKTLHGQFFVDWLVGSLLVGPFIGSIAGMTIGALIARRARIPATPLSSAIDAIYSAALPDGRLAAEILRGKIRHDQVYAAALSHFESPTSMLDVGGGSGNLPLLAGFLVPSLRTAIVIDWDERKLSQGRQIADRLAQSIEFRRQDAFTQDLQVPTSDVVTCLDVLHYADLPTQNRLVASLVKALAPGGKLIIRDMNADQIWRTRWTVLQERLCLACKRTRAAQIVPRSGKDLVAQLQSAGLTVSEYPCRGRTPFSNTLWVAVRPT